MLKLCCLCENIGIVNQTKFVQRIMYSSGSTNISGQLHIHATSRDLNPLCDTLCILQAHSCEPLKPPHYGKFVTSELRLEILYVALLYITSNFHSLKQPIDSDQLLITVNDYIDHCYIDRFSLTDHLRADHQMNSSTFSSQKTLC